MEEDFIKLNKAQGDVFYQVAKIVRDTDADPSIGFDPSLRVRYSDLSEVPFEVGYGVSDDDDRNVVRVAIGKDAENMILLNKDAALAVAANIISFASHMDEMNGPSI